MEELNGNPNLLKDEMISHGAYKITNFTNTHQSIQLMQTKR
jgi:hypothetical protein